MIDALLYLAHYCKDNGKMSEAEGYCLRLLDFAGKEKEEAKSLLREIYSTQAVCEEMQRDSTNVLTP